MCMVSTVEWFCHLLLPCHSTYAYHSTLTHAYVHTYIHTYVHTYICTYVLLHVLTLAHRTSPSCDAPPLHMLDVYMHTCTYIHTYNMCIRTFICMLFIFTYIHMLVVECTFLSSYPLVSLFPSSLLSPPPLPPSTIPLSEEFDEALHGGGGEYLTEEAFDAEDSFDVSDVLLSLPPHLLTSSPPHLSDVLPSSLPHLPTSTRKLQCVQHCL